MNAALTIQALIKSREITLKSTKDEHLKDFIDGQISGLQAALKEIKRG